MPSVNGELVVLSGPYKGRRLPMSKRLLRIGREATCDLVLDDEASSRQHAEIEARDGGLFLRDMGSTNGTYLNDAKLTAERMLQDGDRVGVGDTIFLLRHSARSRRVVPNLVFSEEKRGITTRLTLKLEDTRFLDMKEGTTIPDAQRHLTLLHEFMAAISGVLHKPALLERMMDMLFKAFHADRGVILLLTADGEPGQKFVWQRDGLKAENEITISRTMAQMVLHKQESFLSVDAGADERLAASASMQRMKIESVMGVPLKLKDRMLGMVYLDKITGAVPFADMDLRLCSAMALQAAVCLENTNLYSELLDAAEFNNAVLRGLSSGLLVVDSRGWVVRVNQAALSILGLEETALLNKTLDGHEGLSELRKVVQTTLASGQPEDRYEVHVRVGNVSVPLGLSTTVLSDHAGHAVGAVANFRDLTQIRKLEEQVQRTQHLAALGQMAAGVAHEIRTPLNSIRGFTQLIQETLLKPDSGMEKHAEYTTIVIEEVDRMNRIVQDLLDFSRQRELTLLPVKIENLMSDLVREVELEFKAANIKLLLDVASESLPGVLGNGDKLRQVFRNILLNAMQASKPGAEVKVRVATAEGSLLSHRKEGEATEEIRRREVTVEVTDQGAGIAPDVLGKIFDPFFTTKSVGTGLGLSISLKIVDQHGGRIDVKSEAGNGAVFTVHLPAV